jgi:hypothetical protein
MEECLRTVLTKRRLKLLKVSLNDEKIENVVRAGH